MAILAIGSVNIIGDLETPSLLQVNTDVYFCRSESLLKPRWLPDA